MTSIIYEEIDVCVCVCVSKKSLAGVRPNKLYIFIFRNPLPPLLPQQSIQQSACCEWR
jgi:hypothetical protein